MPIITNWLLVVIRYSGEGPEQKLESMERLDKKASCLWERGGPLSHLHRRKGGSLFIITIFLNFSSGSFSYTLFYNDFLIY